MGAFTVTILSEGKKIGSDYGIVSLQVSSEVNRIPHAEMVLIDGDIASQKFEISNSSDFEPGKQIEIKIRYENNPGSENTIFKGLVIIQEVSIEQLASTLTVVIKDAALKLTQNINYELFKELSDSDIIKKITTSHGLKAGAISDTIHKHKEMVQHGCSDWDFIVTRAESNGLLVIVANGELSAKQIQSPSVPKVKVEYGIDEIYSFNIEANGEGQYSEVSGYAWDIKKQSDFNVKKNGGLNLNPGNIKSDALANKLGGKQFAIKTSAALLKEELTAWAGAKLARSQLSLIRGHFAISGRADIKLMDSIGIKGVGERFNGKAIITGFGHRITAGKWITDIQFGLADQWLLHNDGVNSQPASGLLPAVSGLQIGVVAAFKEDPDKELRLQVTLTGNEKKSILWARLANPDAGKERGFFFRPEVGDEVVVGFVNDDPRQAIVIGSLLSSKNVTPKRFGKVDEKNNAKGIVSKKGLVIGFDDEKKVVYIETPGKNTITLDDDGKKIELKDQHGNSILMDKDGITLKSTKDFKLEANGNVEIKGAKVDIK